MITPDSKDRNLLSWILWHVLHTLYPGAFQYDPSECDHFKASVVGAYKRLIDFSETPLSKETVLLHGFLFVETKTIFVSVGGEAYTFDKYSYTTKSKSYTISFDTNFGSWSMDGNIIRTFGELLQVLSIYGRSDHEIDHYIKAKLFDLTKF